MKKLTQIIDDFKDAGSKWMPRVMFAGTVLGSLALSQGIGAASAGCDENASIPSKSYVIRGTTSTTKTKQHTANTDSTYTILTSAGESDEEGGAEGNSLQQNVGGSVKNSDRSNHTLVDSNNGKLSSAACPEIELSEIVKSEAWNKAIGHISVTHTNPAGILDSYTLLERRRVQAQAVPSDGVFSYTLDTSFIDQVRELAPFTEDPHIYLRKGGSLIAIENVDTPKSYGLEIGERYDLIFGAKTACDDWVWSTIGEMIITPPTEYEERAVSAEYEEPQRTRSRGNMGSAIPGGSEDYSWLEEKSCPARDRDLKWLVAGYLNSGNERTEWTHTAIPVGLEGDKDMEIPDSYELRASVAGKNLGATLTFDNRVLQGKDNVTGSSGNTAGYTTKSLVAEVEGVLRLKEQESNWGIKGTVYGRHDWNTTRADTGVETTEWAIGGQAGPFYGDLNSDHAGLDIGLDFERRGNHTARRERTGITLELEGQTGDQNRVRGGPFFKYQWGGEKAGFMDTNSVIGIAGEFSRYITDVAGAGLHGVVGAEWSHEHENTGRIMDEDTNSYQLSLGLELR